jgi:hypothetical protein
MTRTLLTLTIAAAAALAGCNKEDHTIVAGPAAEESPPVNTVGVELPPSIEASKIYRCKDNSVAYIDWLRDASGKPAGANFRSDKNGTPTLLKADVDGQPLIAEGYSLTGTAQSATITLTRPGKSSQSCKA